MSDKNTRQIIRLKNVRLSFPSLFEARKFAPTDAKGAVSATFLLDKKVNAIEIAEIKRAIDGLVKDNFKGKHPGARNVCLREGSEKPDTEGYGDGVMFISARTDKRPQVVNRDLSALTEADGKPYAGCYVYATIEIWPQDNAYGKRINAKLRTVQFYKDGEPFGAGQIDVRKELEEIPDDEENLI